MFLLRQLFPNKKLSAIKEATKQALEQANFKGLFNTGDSVAITAGSRGINNISLIMKAVVDYVYSQGGLPTVLASMGSHGGGSVSGQLEVLKGLQITPDSMECPVLACDTSLPLPEINGTFYINGLAFDFDRIVVVNRIKPHTSFHGPVESGLMKMLAVGLGGPEGASRIHALGINALPGIIPEVASVVLKHLPVTLGLAILEDLHENTMAIEAVLPEKFMETEQRLLEVARKHMPGIPFDDIDILIVEEIGKIFSGTGMDTNVIDRIRITGVPEPLVPRIKRIVALGLAHGGKGNAYGIGLADFTTRRLVDGIDLEAMYLNAMTSSFVQRAMIPMTFPDDLTAIRAAIKSLGNVEPDKIRMVRIKNTLDLEFMQVSRPLADEASGSPCVEILAQPAAMAFDEKNQIISLRFDPSL